MNSIDVIQHLPTGASTVKANPIHTMFSRAHPGLVASEPRPMAWNLLYTIHGNRYRRP